MATTLVVKLGGSVLLDDSGQLLPSAVSGALVALEAVRGNSDRTILVIGAAGAHYYIDPARSLGASELTCDSIGLRCARAAARVVLVAAKGKAQSVSPSVVESVDDLDAAVAKYSLVVVGPIPGSASSQDSVAALVAEHVQAETLLYLKKYDFLEFSGAGLKAKGNDISLPSLAREVLSLAERAGHRPLLDSAGIGIIQRSAVSVYVMTLSQLLNARHVSLKQLLSRGYRIIRDGVRLREASGLERTWGVEDEARRDA